MKTLRISLLLCAATLICAFTTSALAQLDNGGKSQFAKLDGVRIHYVSYGKGDEALVLIHGWSQNADAWRDNIAGFANRSRVIVVELPGHGESDKPGEGKGKAENAKDESKNRSTATLYSMDHFARAVDAVMRDAKVKRAVLVGHSMGTPVSRQFYRKYPEKTLAIVIVDGSLRPFGDKAVMDQMMTGLSGPKYRDAVGQMMTMIGGPSLSPETKQRINGASMNAPQYVLVSAFAGMLDQSIWTEDKINVPVLAIMAKSPFLPANADESFRAIAPNLDFQLWDGVGHFLMMEKPKEFDATVIAWLDKNKLLPKH